MKKIRWMIIVLVVGIGLAGYFIGKPVGPEQARESCVYIDKEGRFFSVLVAQYEEADEDPEGLRSFAEEAAAEYNESKGADPESVPPPVSIQGCRMEKGTAALVFEYASAGDLIEFSAREQDSTVELAGLETGTVADGLTEGKIIDGSFISARNGKEAPVGTVAKKSSSRLVTVYGPGTIRTAGKIIYITQGVTVVDDYTVKTPQGKSYIIFK